MTETIEGTAVDVTEERALVVQQPGNALVARPQDGPADMIAHATRLATALSDIVERQTLYSVISGKKFPRVEAWMTIGRMDNVVAREAEPPVRHEDASYEAFVELIRLSDGMVIGRASAICGTQDDNPWKGRAEPARRAMAVTRATSRAFRMQYSWIMALAGYEPTPAEEMDKDEPPAPASRAHADATTSTDAGGDGKSDETEELVGRARRRGIIRKGSADGYKLTVIPGPEGESFGFRLEIDETLNKSIPQCAVAGPLGHAVYVATSEHPETLLGTVATIAGMLYNVKRKGKPFSWYRLHVDLIETDEWILPEPPADVELVGERPEAETAPLFDDVA